jgi:hypothetical protein
VIFSLTGSRLSSTMPLFPWSLISRTLHLSLAQEAAFRAAPTTMYYAWALPLTRMASPARMQPCHYSSHYPLIGQWRPK